MQSRTRRVVVAINAIVHRVEATKQGEWNMDNHRIDLDRTSTIDQQQIFDYVIYKQDYHDGTWFESE
jgi:hypothetical protein